MHTTKQKSTAFFYVQLYYVILENTEFLYVVSLPGLSNQTSSQYLYSVWAPLRSIPPDHPCISLQRLQHDLPTN